ncbi:hypothetical protein WT88_29545 [Burkholderia stagnalis]|uniref:hypothetical protein n=1 Tax=Burkholderia stagnalis TaxID=1503054 RepID=UPI00075E7DE2|nr:hypothetical protein [Burkholderia stagnalis]KVZ18628.1 hypothetical protein WT35_04485 [Burkholderia stagnalis]KWN32851.1 hypothetical protein WT86_18610 [Burkholderia stagnalis]KWN44678.1 hypothetical protein WT88_29545 [Burkholderia stagnalis]KWN54411.1 hypothetical protein WT87_03640 [Burkholderia stagnalis]KWO68818.1 hypothetical protein WT99_21010 [Burkholderia stagnalis]
MTGEKTYTRAQLREAFVRWEKDVRADRQAFASDAECREMPLDEHADASVDVLLGYVGGDAP